MEISNSCSGLMKKETNDSCLYFQDKDLSSYIYLKNFQQINLEKKELEKDFLRAVLPSDIVMKLSDIYLSVLKNSELEKFKALKHEDRFDLDEVVEALSRDLSDNFQKYGIVFFLLNNKLEREYQEENPLIKIIERPYMKDFFDGLELNLSERILFLLAIANEEWGWLFPEFKNEEYKAHLFCHICEIEKKDEIAYSRKINSELIKLGLFDSPWKIKDYVYSYFKNESPAFSLEYVKPFKWGDIYDYKKVSQLNRNELKIIRKLKGFITICSDSDYRNKFFLADFYKNSFNAIYELKEELKGYSKAELEFYIYTLSLKIKGSALFLNSSQVKHLLEEEPVSPLQELMQKNKISSSILEKLNGQVILSIQNFDEEIRSQLLAQGIDVLYTLNLKLPEAKNYQESFMTYCFEEEAPVNFMMGVTEECEKIGVKPEQWKSVITLLKNIRSFYPEEALEVVRNKYGGSNKTEKLRKNSHYCMEALNTSEPIKELTNALKNADDYQQGQYDEESGIKVLLYGISGGGKTAYAEEVSKKMNRSLKIVRPSEVLSKWVGETEQNISNIFKEAAKEHSILLVDEADSFLHNRGDSVNHFEDSKVNSFLIEIERYPGILFCSTNLPDILDKAVDRRFNFKVGFKALTQEGVALLCKSYFESFELDESQVSKIYNSGEVTPGDFASLNGKLRFLAPEKRNAAYITESLCKIVRDKKRSYDSNKIGFGA